MPSRMYETAAQSPCIFSRSFLPTSSAGSAATPRNAANVARTIRFMIGYSDSSLVVGGHGDAHHFLVVASKHRPAGKRRVRPDHVPATCLLHGVEDVRPVDFLVSARRQVSQDQIAVVIEKHAAIALLHQESRAAIGLLAAGDGEGLPKLLARFRFQAAQLAHGADAIDVAV